MEPVECDVVAVTGHQTTLALLAELAMVKAAIRHTRKPTSPDFDEATTAELLGLCARERAVLRQLRSRRRQWQAEIGIAGARLPESSSTAEPVRYSRRGTGPAGEDVGRRTGGL